MTNKKTRPTPLTFPLSRSTDTWADAYQYVLAACRAVGIEIPVDARQMPILWKVECSTVPREQFDRFIQALIDQVEILGATDEFRTYLHENYNLSNLTGELDMFLRSTQARADRGSDLSDPEPAGMAVADWLARHHPDEAPQPESVLDIVTGGGKRVHEALVCDGDDWDPDFRAAMTRYRDACHLIDLVNANWRSLRDHRDETTPHPLPGSFFPFPTDD